MFDRFSALKKTVDLFETRRKFPDVNLKIPGRAKKWANIDGFMGQEHLYPSLDFRRESGIDTSFWFGDDNGGKEQFQFLKEDLIKAFTAVFHPKIAKTRRRGYGSSVIVHAYRGDEPDLEETAVSQIVCEQFEKMLRVGTEVLERSNRTINELPSRESLDVDLARRVAASARDEAKARLARLTAKESLQTLPRKITTMTVAFDRDPDVIAEALYRARGICSACKKHAPFDRVLDNNPFLEVHHRMPLSRGGLDNMDNVVALCPNCHRDMHHGPASVDRGSNR